LFYRVKIKNWIIVSVAFLFLFSSCKKECFETVGEDAELEIPLEAFNKIEFHNNFIINLIQDTVNYVVLEGKENMISNVVAEVSNKTLSFKNNNTCTLFKAYHNICLNIHFMKFDEIFIDGSPQIFSKDTLSFENLFIENKGDLATWNITLKANKLDIKFHAIVGELRLNGIVNQMYLYSSGSNHCFFRNLQCQSAEINHTSLGDIYLSVIEKLNLSINSSGNFYCYGNPIDTNIFINKNSTGTIFFEK